MLRVSDDYYWFIYNQIELKFTVQLHDHELFNIIIFWIFLLNISFSQFIPIMLILILKNFFKTFFMYSETIYPKQTKLDLKGLWMILIQTSLISKMVTITDNRKMSSNINCSCMTISCSNCFSVNLCICK